MLYFVRLCVGLATNTRHGRLIWDKAAHLQPQLIFDHNHLLRMSISSLGTDLELCDLEVASAMSSPRSQQPPLARFEDDEFRPVPIDQLDAQAWIPLPLALTSI